MASVTKALICNLALSHINQTQSSIANLDTDSGNTAVQCRIHFEVSRRFVLAYHNWGFAKKRITLSDLGSPPGTWLYRYDYPSDCLRFREIERFTRNIPPVPFEVESDTNGTGLCVLTDQEEAVGIYTRDVTNVSLFPPAFVTAFSWHLASELAMAIPGDMELQKTCFNIYRAYLMSAEATDSEEGTQDPEIDSPWQRARGNGDSI